MTALCQGPANQVARPIDESQVITRLGNTHPLARAEFDEGAVSPETPLDRMVLHLSLPAPRQADLDALVRAQHDPDSPLYHQWLTPAQYGARFGTGAQDLALVGGWLKAHGFTVDEIPASSRDILFSGTAGQVWDTFHTEIHRYRVQGAVHIANAQDPQIPRALAGLVDGVVSLHSFRRSSAITSRRALAAQPPVATAQSGAEARPQYTSGTTNYLYPADWATIYDLNSLYSAGTKGSGASIAIVGRSNIHLSDVSAFRQASGLPANNPQVILVSTDPGIVAGDQDESTLDVEWSGAIAPAATVKFVVGASSATSDGVDLAAQYIVNHATAPIVSLSYGSCEQDMGTTELAFYNSLWQQAASLGISVFVSSGDSGAAGCYWGGNSSASGAGINGLCSSPYSTCVGGTEFNEGNNETRYWGATNPSNEGSALSYIPEVVWNESGSNGGSGLWASTGGVSVVYPQPAWQKGLPGAGAANGMRTVPDIAMDAASHDAYIISENGSYWTIAGTSAASPSFAGVMALLVQSQGSKGQGNANPGLYALLNASRNPFHPTPSGNNSVPGVTGFTASGAEYNLATGLGSVDGAALVSSWGAGGATAPTDFALTSSAASGTIQAGSSTTFTVTATQNGTARNTVALTAKAPAGIAVTISPASLASGVKATVTVAVASTATAGTPNITITGSDTSGSQTLTYALTVNQPPTLTLAAASSSATVTPGSNVAVAFTATTGGSFTGNISLSVTGLPAGVTANWSANPLTPSSSTRTSASTLTLAASSAAAAGTATITITASGDGLTASQKLALQVQQVPGVTLSVSPASISMQSLATSIVTVTATPVGGLTPASEKISLASGLPKGFTATFSSPSVATSGVIVWTLTLTGSSSAAAGSSTLALTAQITAKTGTVYTLSQSVPMTVTLTPPSLTIAAASTTPSVTAGSTVTDTIALTANAMFTVPVTLGVSGLPSGVTASWSANPVTLAAAGGSSTLTFTATPAAAAGTSAITVTATGNGLSVTQKLTLTVVVPAPALVVTPASATMTVVNPVEAITSTQTSASQLFTFTGSGSFKGPVSLVVSGLPPHITASWSSNPVTMSASNTGTSTLTVTAGQTSQNGAIATVPPGSYTFTVTATGSGLTVVKNIQLQVAGILVVPQTTTITIHRGSSGTLAVTTTPAGGASGVAQLGLSANASPSGITVQATPASIPAPGSGTTIFKFTVSSTAALKTYQLLPAAALFPSAASTTPQLLGWSSGPVTLNIVQ